ncbi:DUF2510 domain-containing protein [Kitasatospora sp. NPDC004745]|uniref:DUF2510 domain-containing protein n=1 Tax=Kitasatospora sp. NPDC004745 TaxID=3364019 RepID=UPI0036AB05EF
MSNSTPPGWYPVSGADGTAGHERWWDGNAWTSEVRPLQGGAAGVADAPTQGWKPSAQQPGYGYGGPQDTPGYGYPGSAPAPGYGYPGQDGQGGSPAQGVGYGYGYPAQPAPGRVRPGMLVGIGLGVLAVGGIIAGIVLNSGGSPQADPTPVPTVTITQGSSPSPSPTASAPTVTPTLPTPKPAPAVKSTVPDAQHAITVPVLDGWDAGTDSTHSTVFLGTGRYTCADGNSCIRGQFSVEKDTVQGATAKAAAEATMPTYAGQIFTGITSHTDSGSGYATVAGVFGYAVRWHVRTSDGTQGYVLLAAVPAKGGGFVVFQGGVDDDPKAPDASVLDQILKGIQQDGTSGGGSTT